MRAAAEETRTPSASRVSASAASCPTTPRLALSRRLSSSSSSPRPPLCLPSGAFSTAPVKRWSSSKGGAGSGRSEEKATSLMRNPSLIGG